MKGDKRPIKDMWSYNGDGRFDDDRIKGKDKRRLRRWRRQVGKVETAETVNESIEQIRHDES